MKNLIEENVYKELLSISVSKEKLDNIYLTSLKGVVDDVLTRYKGFPKSVIKKRADIALNIKGKELLFNGKLNLNYEELSFFLDSNKIHPKLKNDILESDFDGERDEEYDKLKMFEEEEYYGIVSKMDYKIAFKEFKSVMKAKGQDISLKNDKRLERNRSSKLDNKPKPKLE
jgi:hypothetical protein